MAELTVPFECPKCNTKCEVTVEGEQFNAPDVRSRLTPTREILVYEITSEQMKTFITKKAKAMVPGTKVEVATRYCEKKKREKYEPHRSYASLRIALSDAVIEKNDANGWYGKIGIDSNSVSVTKSILNGLIRKYGYNVKDIQNWLSSYKTMEELENLFGMSESYIQDLKEFAIPKRVPAGNESWVIFSAAAENVIADMLTDVGTKKVAGRIEVADIVPLSKDIVKFIVYLHPMEQVYTENPDVRKILMGNDKKNK